MCSVEKISLAYATPMPPASWRSCAPLSSPWCAALATIHSKSPKRSSLIIPTKPSGCSVVDRLPEWSVKSCHLTWVKSDTNAVFEIKADLQNQPVLFDFMGPGDALDLLMSIS